MDGLGVRVKGSGPLTAKIVFVGEAPSHHEIRRGEPFVGPAGIRWNEWIRQFGLNRYDFRLENLCLKHTTRVLLPDLTWKEIGQVEIGDQLLAFDEEGLTRGPKLRRWRIATVTGKQVSQKPCLSVTTANGTLVGTPNHRVLVSNKNKNSGTVYWGALGKISSNIAFLFRPWGPARSIQEAEERGWLAGFFDGEGSLCSYNDAHFKRPLALSFGQNTGVTLDRAIEYMMRAGFSPGVCQPKGRLCTDVRLRGRAANVLYFLGMIRPVRLLKRWKEILENTPPVIRFGAAKILTKEDAGVQTVVDLETTTKTFIAEGFGVHNCEFQVPKMDAVSRESLEPWMSDLHDRIAALPDPWIIVPAGNYPLYALTGKGKVSWHQRDGASSRPGILDWRGSILPYTDRRGRLLKIIPTIHPAATFRQPTLERSCLQDWQRIHDEYRSGREVHLPVRQHCISPALADLQRLLRDVHLSNGRGVLAIDIENPRRRESRLVDNPTTGRKVKRVMWGDPEIVCIGFSLDPHFSLTVPLTTSYWGSDDTLNQVWDLIKQVCESPIPKVLHNGLYDCWFLSDRGISLVNWQWDTMAMHHCLDPSSEHTLAYCASVDTREPFWKHEAKDPDEAAQYANNWQAFLCVDEETEAFTPEGWVKHDSLKPGDTILAYNPQTDRTAWEVVQDKFEKFYHGDLVSLWWRGEEFSLTTPNHKWWIRDGRGRGRKTTSAGFSIRQGRRQGWQVPMAGSLPMSTESRRFFDNVFVELVAWVVTEGTIRFRGNSPEVVVYQSPMSKHYHDFERVLRFHGSRPRHLSHNEHAYALPVAVAREVLRYVEAAPYKRPKWPFYWMLTHDQLSLFIETAVKGDGTVQDGASSLLQTARSPLLEDIQGVMATLGWGSTRRERKGTDHWNGKPSARMSILPGKWMNVVRRKDRLYRGVVWCPSVPSGYWVARRRGTVHITGNTYNGKDVSVTRELYDVYFHRLSNTPRGSGTALQFYLAHYAEIFGPLHDLSRHGFRVDTRRQRLRLGRLLSECIRLQDRLSAATGVQLYAAKGLSTKRLQDYLYRAPSEGGLGLPVQHAKRDKVGTKTASANEVAVRKLMVKHPAVMKDIGPLILEHRRLQQLSTFYRVERIDADGRFRSGYTFNTEAGRLASRRNPSGTGCLKGEVEVLTPTGWIRLDQFDGTQYAAQWLPADGRIIFAPAEPHSVSYTGPLHETSAWFHRMAHTPDHTVPVCGLGKDGKRQKWRIGTALNKTFSTRTAAKAAQLQQLLTPISGHYHGGSVSFPLIRLLAAVQADGSIDACGSIRIAFKKPRKIERWLRLCQENGLTPVEQSAPLGFRRFGLSVREAEPIVRLLTRQKMFGPWLLHFDYTTLRAFIDELQYWDGHSRKRSFQYATTIQSNAEWVCTIAHLVGYSTSSRVNSHNYRGGYGSSCNKPLWIVGVKPRAYAQIAKKHWRTVTHTGLVYCLKTLTGFFLVRSNGRIVITGNSNAQNIDRAARDIFLADEGCIGVEIDLSQAEARIDYLLIHYLTGDRELLEKARLRPDEYDQHTENAAGIFGIPQADVTKEQRYLGKKAVHAAFRDMHGSKLADELLKDGYVRTPDECQAMLDAFIARVPGIHELFRWVRRRMIKDRFLENSWGRRLYFTYDRLDDECYRRGYSFDPQSEVADLMNQYGLKPLWAKLQIPSFGYGTAWINAHVHDSLFISVKPEAAWDVAKFLVTSLEQPRTYHGVTLSMPCEIKLGKSWQTTKEFKRLPEKDVFNQAVQEVLA